MEIAKKNPFFYYDEMRNEMMEIRHQDQKFSNTNVLRFQEQMTTLIDGKKMSKFSCK